MSDLKIPFKFIIDRVPRKYSEVLQDLADNIKLVSRDSLNHYYAGRRKSIDIRVGILIMRHLNKRYKNELSSPITEDEWFIPHIEMRNTKQDIDKLFSK